MGSLRFLQHAESTKEKLLAWAIKAFQWITVIKPFLIIFFIKSFKVIKLMEASLLEIRIRTGYRRLSMRGANDQLWSRSG